MKICVLIPCYNHASTVAAVARSAREFFPVLVVDDGSTASLPELPDCTFSISSNTVASVDGNSDAPLNFNF